MVTARERHDWVNAGIALRRRATVAADAAFQKDGRSVAAMVARQHGANERGESEGGESSSSSFGGGGGENDVEGGEDYVERVLRTRAAVDAMLSEQDTARTARLANFVEREIANIRGEQAEEYAQLAKEDMKRQKLAMEAYYDVLPRDDGPTPGSCGPGKRPRGTASQHSL